MTPKEKAKELLEKMYYVNQPYTYEIKPAKQCALICVDEILSMDLKAKCESQFVIERRIEEYWNEVKQEIEKL